MATTSDLAPTRARRTPGRPRVEREHTEHLEEQISRLQDDLKAVTATLARLSGERVAEVRDTARGEYKQLVRSAQSVAGGVGEQAESLERQMKDTIRERPLAAIAAAIGLGFLLALLSRR